MYQLTGIFALNTSSTSSPTLGLLLENCISHCGGEMIWAKDGTTSRSEKIRFRRSFTALSMDWNVIMTEAEHYRIRMSIGHRSKSKVPHGPVQSEKPNHDYLSPKS